MKKQEIKSISSIITDKIMFCTSTMSLYINDCKISKAKLKYYNWYYTLLSKIGIHEREVEGLLIDYCKSNNLVFDSNSIKLNEKRLKDEAKAEEKRLKDEAKEEKKKTKEESFRNAVQVEQANPNTDKDGEKYNNGDCDEQFVILAHKNGRMLYNERFEGVNEWKNHLIYKKELVDIGEFVLPCKSLKPMDIAANYYNYFEYCPKYTNKLMFNDRTCTLFMVNDELRDINIRWMYSDVENDTGLSSRCKVDDAYIEVAYEHKFNDLQDYLCKVASTWDGIPRAEKIFIDKMKANDSIFTREATLTWLIGAVKRAMQPGCKNEVMLILIGSQGDGKTTILNRLFEKFGVEANIDISNEQSYGMKIRKVWAVIVDELADFNKKEGSQYKKWLSIQQDSYRDPYQRIVEPHKRYCCYCGTTNDKYFLKDYSDPNGERRYWPITCHSTKDESWDMIETLTDDYIDSIWAEVAYKYFENPNIPIDIRGEAAKELESIQEQHKTSNEDMVHEQLLEYLDRKKPYILQNDGSFEDENDMINQMKGMPRDLKSGEKMDYINKISSKNIKVILGKLIHSQRKHDYFVYNFKGKWDVNTQDGEWNTKVYRRINEKHYNQNIESNNGYPIENQLNIEGGLPF